MRKYIKNKIQKWNSALRLDIDQLPASGMDNMPTGLLRFIWFFIRQIKFLIFGIAIVEASFAILISVMFWYVGELVEQTSYSAAMITLGAALLLLRFVTGTLSEGFYHLIYIPYVGNLVRRQLYWYTARQSLAFFQNDFAGRIANKLLQSAPSLRDAVRSTIGVLLFAAVFTFTNLWFLASANIWLAAPLGIWLCLYTATLFYFVPRVQARSFVHSEQMSALTGQIVDTFTNALPTKYFARTDHEDKRIVSFLDRHSETFRDVTATIWVMSLVIDILNTALLAATGAVGYWLIQTQGQIGVAAIAMALPMAFQATFQSGWIMREVSSIFENLGRVQEGIDILTRKHDVTDQPGAPDLKIGNDGAEIIFRNVTFDYGTNDRPVIKNFNLSIPPGQKLGLVGTSGAGKSTITNLLVRAHDLRGGEILINGQNIAHITQDSLRENITIVTQESYLFHCSVMDNIRYGKLEATMEDIIHAARRASAHDFILDLEDNKGRKAFKAHVGERGVKLSGGQKQRIGIARAILKDAPILILDEATSALDSESEHAIQTALESIMDGKTVIAVAHRLSTLRQMDRIIVMSEGKIIEDGTHDDLIDAGGHYAKLWKMQSGGFLKEDAKPSSGTAYRAAE